MVAPSKPGQKPEQSSAAILTIGVQDGPSSFSPFNLGVSLEHLESADAKVRVSPPGGQKTGLYDTAFLKENLSLLRIHQIWRSYRSFPPSLRLSAIHLILGY